MSVSASPLPSQAARPIDAGDMRFAFGVGPARTTCEDCAYLKAIAGPRPHRKARSLPLTVFVCLAASSSAPWSVLYDTCGMFRRA